MSAIGPTSTREIMSDMGVNPTLASMATPGLYWTPAESDPQSAITMVIVQGIQKALKKLGFPLRTHGSLDSATQNAIAEVAGRNWASQPWIHIYITIKQLDDYEPRTQITWKQNQSTAIGEALGLDDIYDAMGDVAPKESYYGSLPTSAIACVGEGTKEYCYGKTAIVIGAFKALQKVVGVTVDGKIGSGTAGVTVRKLNETWLSRFTLSVTPEDSDLMARIISGYQKSQRPAVVAASADRLAAVLVKYKAAVKPVASTPKPPPVRLSPTEIDMTPEALPPPAQAGFGGGGTLGILAAALLGGWLLFGRKGIAGKPTRRKSARRRPRRSSARRRR